jgi:hypothetical protein
MGYVDWDPSDYESFKVWGENNYAEITARSRKEKTVIMASSGCGNRELTNFVAAAFQKHRDIKKVFFQSTYWGRFPFAMNPDLDEKSIFPLDFFMKCDEQDDLVEKWSIGLQTKEKYVQLYLKPETFDYETLQYNPNTSPENQPPLRQVNFMYVKMWHYLQTHLEQQDYFRDIALADAICNYNDAKMYLWNINPRCFIPKETNSFYMNLKNTVVAEVDATTFLLETQGYDLSKNVVDGEHYSVEAHEMISKYYIPYLEGLA